MVDSYPDLLCWIDLETTGLNPDSCQILEIGLLLTDSKLQRLDSRSWVIGHSAYVLGGMDEWCLRQHGKTGLIADCAGAKLGRERVESEVLDYLLAITQAAGGELEGRVPMCGASIHFDRAFLRKWMSRVEQWFYYGNLDVSSVEKLARLWYPELKPWEGRELHRVDPDNEDAVAELAYYREHIFLAAEAKALAAELEAQVDARVAALSEVGPPDLVST